MTGDIEVGFVGLGTIAKTHLEVLSELPQASLQFVVDTDPEKSASFRGQEPPRYKQLDAALHSHQPDLVVIATPTETHVDLAHTALTQSTARVLVEKPLVHDLGALAQFRPLQSSGDLGSRLLVAHHFAFSPEVVWGSDQLEMHPEWGPITRLTCSFHDAYISDAEHSFAAYVSSWVDSGVNQLSMLSRFVEFIDRGPLNETGNGATSWCTATFRSGDTEGTALLRASWQAVATSKRSTICLGESGVEIWLDHTAVTGFVVQDGEITDQLVNDGRTPRKTAHYRPLYESLLSDAPDPILGFDTAASILELLYR